MKDEGREWVGAQHDLGFGEEEKEEETVLMNCFCLVRSGGLFHCYWLWWWCLRRDGEVIAHLGGDCTIPSTTG